MEVLKLRKPVMIDGSEHRVIEFDFENLEATAVELALKAVTKTQHVVMAQETDALLHAAIFAQAAGIDYTDVKRFSAIDYMEAGRLVRDFFFFGSEDGSEPTS